MRNLCFVLAGVIALGAWQQAPAQTGALPASIRTDGLYQSPGSKPDTYAYLRFYKDGAVAQSTSSGTPVEVAKWLSKTHEYSGVGQVNGDARTIAFTSKSKSGNVDFQGTVEKDGLKLTTYSHINKFRGSYFYKFVPVAFPPVK